MSRLSPAQNLLLLMLRAQQLASTEASDRGYAMIFVSIVTVMIFSLLGAYLTISNISKSATNAYTESNSTFYAAESGLNQRADAVRQKFINYATPSGVSPGYVAGRIAGPENMVACLDNNLGNDGSGDFVCQRLNLNYQQSSEARITTGGDGKSLAATNNNNRIKYTAYTFVSDRTVYLDPIRRIPQVQPIPSGQVYAGLNALEYRYTVYSMATSKQPQNLDAKATTVLEMTFKNRTIPLFQFAAFYNGDLEMNSTSQMDINGRVHSNANLYIQPTPLTTETTRLLGSVTAAGSIYNRVDAVIIPRFGTTQVLLTGDPNNPGASGNTYQNFPSYDVARITPLISTEIASFNNKVLDGAAGASNLMVPQPGFLRKRDSAGEIGEYYGKADLRLEMFPKRATGNVPFNFTAIKDGGTGGSCTGFNLSSGRQGTSLNCTQLNEGQLRSLQQPVMAKVLSDEERTRFCPSLTSNYNPSSGGSRKKLRALQVAIAAQNTTIAWNQLSLPLSNPANASIRSIALSLESLNDSDTPIAIAANEGACFLPAPIQAITGSGGANTNYNWQSGYYDRREQRWIGMLQTNIGSLTLWNRDGLYVDRDNDLTSNDAPTNTQATAAFNNGDANTNDTNSLLFIRAAAQPTAATGSFQKLGLAASDTSEGGLVYYATVSDDLNGDGTNDLTTDTTDNLRIYPDGKRKSPYGFAITGGGNLLSPLTFVTDRALYVQGDYNNFASDTAKQPAALIGDSITVLSTSCLDNNTTLINCGILTGQNNATSTQINAAFLSYTAKSNGNQGVGRDDGVSGQVYSGGLNNYMRMTENWAGQNFNYTGSFVSLGTPQEYSGKYLSGAVVGTVFTDGSIPYYNVPNRNFKYDIDFNAFDRLPPLTPQVIYLQQETFKRTYN